MRVSDRIVSVAPTLNRRHAEGARAGENLGQGFYIYYLGRSHLVLKWVRFVCRIVNF